MADFLLVEIDIVCRVHIFSIITNTKMKVRSSGVTSSTTITNHLTGFNHITSFYNKLCHMLIPATIAIQMVNFHKIASGCIVFCNGH